MHVTSVQTSFMIMHLAIYALIGRGMRATALRVFIVCHPECTFADNVMFGPASCSHNNAIVIMHVRTAIAGACIVI